MKKFKKKKNAILLLYFLFTLFFLSDSAEINAYQEDKISEPGKYKGYSEPIYDEWMRQSLYIPVRDGTRLAADIHRPAIEGRPAEKPLPLIWIHTRYHRANYTEGGKVVTYMQNPALRKILSHGYIIAVVDVHVRPLTRPLAQEAVFLLLKKPRILMMLWNGLLNSPGVMEISGCMEVPIWESHNILRQAWLRLISKPLYLFLPCSICMPLLTLEEFYRMIFLMAGAA